MTLHTATVRAAYGRQFWLAPGHQPPVVALARGRNQDIVTGDRVQYRLLHDQQALIETVLPRKNALTRSDARRSKTIAANLDQAAIVLSGEPPFSEALLLRVLIAAERQQIACSLIATKADIPGALDRIAPRLSLYEALGYPVYRVATCTEPELTAATLLPFLKDQQTLLLGQSGMGKSTLVNLLIPEATLATQTISAALHSGRHTTTFTRAFALPAGGLLIDSPGFQLFGLEHLSNSEIEHGLREFQPLLGQCRFHNCSHCHEPGCAILTALNHGQLDARRHALYTELRHTAHNRF